MTDERLRALYQRSLRIPGGEDRPACPPPERLVALVARQGPETERLASLDHVLACAACRSEFELLRSLETAASHSRWPAALAPLALAASLVLAVGGGVLLWRAFGAGGDSRDVYRGAPAGVALVHPAGDVGVVDSRVFTWRALPKARGYAFELLAADGTPVFSGETADTSLTLPASVHLRPGEPYRWWVRAELESGLEERSPTAEFRLRER